MGIDVEWVDENQSAIQFLSDGSNEFAQALLETNKLGKTYCLRFIDPSGDTVFNQSQIRELINELEQLQNVTREASAKKQLKSLITLAKQADGHVHTYLKFVGD